MIEKFVKFLSRLLGEPEDTLPGGPASLSRETNLGAANRRFTKEMFARLLTELPAHRRLLVEAHTACDDPRLRAGVHKLLGAVAYCDARMVERKKVGLHKARKRPQYSKR